MLRKTWREKYEEGIREKGTLLTVGLDPTIESMPKEFWGEGGVLDYLKVVVDLTHENAIAYKLNSAFYEVMGEEGIRTILDIKRYINSKDSSILTILDGKRGDIAHTAEAYAKSIYEKGGFDSTTVNPYMGWDAITPFYRWEGRLTIVLVRSSNPSGDELQMWGEPPLYKHLCKMIVERDDRYDLGAVVGATHPKELQVVREILGRKRAILVPGVGAQGGNAEAVLRAGEGILLINVSRGVLHGWKDDEWPTGVARAAERYAMKMKVDQVERFM